MGQSFGTTDVAKLCKVSPRTVAKWFDQGLLRGHLMPGSRTRRIPREALERFLAEHKMLGALDALRAVPAAEAEA